MESAVHPALNAAEAIQQFHPALRARAELELRRRANTPKPQPGPQTAFLNSTADIAIFGGAAFSSKSFGLLTWASRDNDNPLMRCVLFRRTMPEIKAPGGLWDESVPMFRAQGSEPAAGVCEHHFPSGAYVKMGHLQYDSTVYDWDSAQIPKIGFDQLEQFTEFQFFYMLSRNRSMSGLPAQIRAACNPDADSWLAKFIAWWIDPDTGYPIKERSGVIRFFVREGDEIIWGDTAEELINREGGDTTDAPTSVTFIPGTMYDNPIGMAKNPKYVARLKALPRVQRERLLGGNWKIRPAAGLMFQREWCRGLEVAPTDLDRSARFWDLAATEEIQGNDPDWTVGVKMAKYKGRNRWVILDARRMRKSAFKVEDAIKNTAVSDGRSVQIGYPQDPGQAGKSQAAHFTGMLAGFNCWSWSETGDKETRFGPFSAQCEAGNVDYVLGAWNDPYLSALENFPDGKHKDDADASSGVFEMLTNGRGGIVVIDDSTSEFGGGSVLELEDAPWN